MTKISKCLLMRELLLNLLLSMPLPLLLLPLQLLKSLLLPQFSSLVP